MHPWDRLEAMNLSSVQRRHERYMAIYCWKILQAEVANNGGIEAQWTSHKGRQIILPRLRGSQSVKTLRVNSFTFRAGKIFNSLPMAVPNFGGAGTTLGEFKSILGDYLNRVPDRPRDLVNGLMPEPVDSVSGQNSNSLVHWRIYLEKSYPEYKWY